MQKLILILKSNINGAVGIGVELDKGLPHPEHSMKLSDKGERVINAT
jgi:hypothetical protein